MTCVVGIEYNNKVFMGSDSCAFNEDGKMVIDSPKLTLKGDLLFGYAGSFRIANLISHSLTIPKRPKKMSDAQFLITKVIKKLKKICEDDKLENDNMLLLGYNSKLYCISHDFSLVRTLEEYDSIGVGCNIARGSLHTTRELKNVKIEDRLRLALKAASNHMHGVSEPFHYMSI